MDDRLARTDKPLYWGTRDPVGTFVELGGTGGARAEVIAVSGDARFYSLDQPSQPMYTIQRTTGGGATLLIRAARNPETVLGAIRSAMGRTDVPLTLMRLRTMDEVLESSLAMTRAITGTLTVVGILAALLATVGLYGVVSYITSGRTKEFGVRLALGATRRSISRLVVVNGLSLTVIGGMLGTAAGLALLQVMEGMLFSTRGLVGLVAAVWCVLAAVTVAACTVPALRAIAIPPASALRAD